MIELGELRPTMAGVLVTGPYVALRGIHRLLATTFAG